MRVLYFGTYEREYPRNAQVISCLRRAGVQVSERHVPVWDDQRHKFSVGFRSLSRLLAAEVRLGRSSVEDFDVMIVGYPGHLDMSVARRVARKRPLVFNPLVSLEDTMIEDRELASRWSPVGLALRAVDAVAFRRSDLVVADTAAQAREFASRFGIPESRLAVCFVGAEDRHFRQGTREANASEVLFVGKLIPLHGLDTILAAAALCPDIPFHIVGSGQLDHVLRTVPPNVRWDRWVEYERVPDLYRAACCALGIFGISEKAARVIPNKAFHALATETPLITADTPAARELLEPDRNAVLVSPGNPDALAVAVRRLVAEPSLRRELALRGRQTYEAHASEDVLGARWRALLERLIDS